MWFFFLVAHVVKSEKWKTVYDQVSLSVSRGDYGEDGRFLMSYNT